MSRFKTSFLVTLALLSLLCCQTLTNDERQLQQRDDNIGGISVGAPKVYDDAVLEQLIAGAQARLATLQVIDQTGIAARLGGLSGVSQQFSALNVSALGRPVSEVTTTLNNATTGTTTTSVTKDTALMASVPTTTGPAAPATTGFGPSASDLLNEQVQLTFEIANLRLLLEGSLSDQVLQSKTGGLFLKPRVTLGFPISITPSRRFRHAVAVVESEVYAAPDENFGGGKQPPMLMSILPREKTYNVAAITDRSTSIGAGVVTQVASVGGSFLSGRRTFYIVKDQDTLATTFQPARSGSDGAGVGFGWQFRPVLSQEIVQAGLRQTFVQISFPTTMAPPTFGKVRVRTYWRNYDPGNGALGGLVPGSLSGWTEYPIPHFDMRHDVGAFVVRSDTQDLGNGTILVHVPGRFLSGTFVRAGTTLFQPGTGLMQDNKGLRFAASLVDIAKGVQLVARDGTETPLVESFRDMLGQRPKFEVVNLTQIDDTNSRLILKTEPVTIEGLPPLAVLIGGKVFGYADAPVEHAGDRQKDGETLSLVVPTALVTAAREVTVKPLFVDSRYFFPRPLFLPDPHPERLTLIKQGKTSLTYLLTGSHFGKAGSDDDLKVVFPKGKRLKAIGDGTEQDSMRLLELSAEDVKQVKSLVVQRTTKRPFLIAIPPPPEAPKSESTTPKPTPPKFAERITVGADDALITGDSLDTVKKITALKHDLSEFEMEGKNLRVKGLAAAGITSTARTVDCLLKNAGDKTVATIQLEVVNSKVESIAK